MGLCESLVEVGSQQHNKDSKSSKANFKEQKFRSLAIDRQLKVKPTRILQKLLLLGPGESGKSTCVKQMRILHAEGFTDVELEEKRCVIYSNIVHGMLAILAGMRQLGISFADEGLKNLRDIRLETFQDEILALEKYVKIESNDFAMIDTSVKQAIKRLWVDEGVRLAYAQRASFQCQDSVNYFFDDIDRIAEKNYFPTNNDVLRARVPTTGVAKFSFIFNEIAFEVVDVGGQRSERRKWIHLFDDVNALIFIAAISEYDQKISEDNRTNRLIEALELFDSIANSRYFCRSSMILFLNKIDLFAEKIRHTSLAVCFPSYKGGPNYDEGLAFLSRRFWRLYKNANKIYTHATCATDTNQLNHIFSSVLDTIIRENLKDTGIL